jgi:3-demethylubiquinone-9 3-methyltransferase
MQKITPCLWFDDQAETAAKFYVSIFKHSKLGHVTRYGEAGAEVSGRPKGSVMTVTFEIEGQEFMALNGGPLFHFIHGAVRVAEGNRRDVGEAVPRWNERAMRLAERQIRLVLADYFSSVGGDDLRQRSRKVGTRHEGHSYYGQARYRGSQASI